jgi:hypothetical protein
MRRGEGLDSVLPSRISLEIGMARRYRGGVERGHHDTGW